MAAGSESGANVALVTGGSRGIGRAIALRLAADGRAVAVNYRTQVGPAGEVVEEITRSGGKAMAVQADISDKEAGRKMVRDVTEKLGPVGILVNNAGLLYSGRLLDYNEDEFERMWQVNVKGLIHATAVVAPSMIERNYGRVVNLSSIAALGTAFEGTTFYAATKAAVLILTKRFALELGPHGITVNAVLPGFTLTDMVMQEKTPDEVERLIEGVSQKTMLRRPGRPQDIAAVVSFLASDDSGFTTGQYLVADGGRMDFLSQG